MSTPTSRRRDYFQGVAFIFLGLMIVASTIYGKHSDDVAMHERQQDRQDFQQCITRVVHGLTDSLTARTNLTDPDASSVRLLIKRILAAKTPAQGQHAIDLYNAAQKDISNKRKANPIPAFPDGKCDS